MTRVIKGIYDDVVLDTGFFVSDAQVDILCDWLDSYADALESAWKRKGAEGEASKQKFTKVRSFKNAVIKARKGKENGKQA